VEFAELWKQFLDAWEELKKEAEKHRFELVKSSLIPFYLEFACSRVASNEVIFYLELYRKPDGSWDFRMKDKNGNYM